MKTTLRFYLGLMFILSTAAHAAIQTVESDKTLVAVGPCVYAGASSNGALTACWFDLPLTYELSRQNFLNDGYGRLIPGPIDRVAIPETKSFGASSDIFRMLFKGAHPCEEAKAKCEAARSAEFVHVSN